MLCVSLSCIHAVRPNPNWSSVTDVLCKLDRAFYIIWKSSLVATFHTRFLTTNGNWVQCTYQSTAVSNGMDSAIFSGWGKVTVFCVTETTRQSVAETTQPTECDQNNACKPILVSVTARSRLVGLGTDLYTVEGKTADTETTPKQRPPYLPSDYCRLYNNAGSCLELLILNLPLVIYGLKQHVVVSACCLLCSRGCPG